MKAKIRHGFSFSKKQTSLILDADMFPCVLLFNRIPWIQHTVSRNHEGDTRNAQSSLQWYQPAILAPGGSCPTKSAILGARQLPAKSPFSEESVLGVVPLFTWGAGADGFKMASRWWQGLDCGRGCSRVPARPCCPATFAGAASLCYLHHPALFFCHTPSTPPQFRCRPDRLLLGRPSLALSRVISAIVSFPLFILSPPLPSSPPSLPTLPPPRLAPFAPADWNAPRAARSPAAACVRCLHDGSEEPLLNYSVATAAAPQSTQRMNKKRVVLKGPVLNPFSDLYSSTQTSVEKTRRRKQNILSSGWSLLFSRPARTDALLDLVWSAVLSEVPCY